MDSEHTAATAAMPFRLNISVAIDPKLLKFKKKKKLESIGKKHFFISIAFSTVANAVLSVVAPKCFSYRFCPLLLLLMLFTCIIVVLQV